MIQNLPLSCKTHHELFSYSVIDNFAYEQYFDKNT